MSYSEALCSFGALTGGSMITNPNYKFYCTIQALGMYLQRFGDEIMQ